jgi:hypothetical protein
MNMKGKERKGKDVIKIDTTAVQIKAQGLKKSVYSGIVKNSIGLISQHPAGYFF